MLKIQSGSFPLNQAQLLKSQNGWQKQGNQKRQSRNIEQEIKKIDKKSHILSKSVHNKFQISLNTNKPRNPIKCFPNHSFQAKISSQSSQNFKNQSNFENEAMQKALKVVEQEIQRIQEEERTQLEKNIQFFQQQFTQLQRKLEKQYKEELEAIDQQLKKNVKTEQLKVFFLFLVLRKSEIQSQALLVEIFIIIKCSSKKLGQFRDRKGLFCLTFENLKIIYQIERQLLELLKLLLQFQ